MKLAIIQKVSQTFLNLRYSSNPVNFTHMGTTVCICIGYDLEQSGNHSLPSTNQLAVSKISNKNLPDVIHRTVL